MIYDLIIIGSGPAGITAAIYASRAQKSVLIIEKETIGGNITHSPKIENYPGYPSISGMDLAEKLVNQVMDMNVSIEFENVIEVIHHENTFTLKCEATTFEGKSILIATGSKHKTLKLENEEKLVGHGLSYCAVCDGPFYVNKDVCVIGGGNSALQEAILLASYCHHVTIIQNLSFLTGEKALIQQIENTPNINVIYNQNVIALNGQTSLDSITLMNLNTKEISTFETEGVFVAIGQEANNEIFKELCQFDDHGFICTNELCQCNIKGVFAAGDCRQKKIRQIVTASSDGAIAALQAIQYLDSLNF